MTLRLIFLYALLLMAGFKVCAQDADAGMADSVRGIAPPLRRSGYQNALTLGIPQMVVQRELRLLTAGIEIRHYFGRKGRVSIHIPIYLGLATHPRFDERSTGSKYREGNTFSMAHGVRYHPFGNRGRADLSVGMQLAAGLINTSQHTQGGQGTWYGTGRSRDGFLALLLQSDLDFQPFHRTIVGMHVSAGPAYVGKADTELRVQVGLKFGGRF